MKSEKYFKNIFHPIKVAFDPNPWIPKILKVETLKSLNL